MAVQAISPLRTHDEEPRRATYGVPYPRTDGADLLIETKQDIADKIPVLAADSTKRRVLARRVSVRVKLRNFDDVAFHDCNFHDQHGKGPANIAEITFRGCEFRRSFFGTVHFHRVRFIDCTFERCDFQNAEFSECVLERCQFTECSAQQALFLRTEVDPAAFLSGIVFPVYNLTGKAPELVRQIQREWQQVRLRLSEQLFRSNSEIFHSQHSDAGLLALKRAQHSAAVDLWRHGASRYDAQPLSLFEALRRDPGGPIRATLRWLNLVLTAGGTSIRNLACVLVILILAYPFLLSSLPITYGGANCTLESLRDYVRLALASASLLLGFGFTAFSGVGLAATSALVLAGVFGVSWYALLIPVLIRRVYR